ncbi:MAG: sulfate permease [Knoellia sp.]
MPSTPHHEQQRRPARRGQLPLGALVPGVARLRRYDRAWLRGDVLAGLTVAAYLVPQVMAYAEIAGLPATAGLWAAVAALLVYAVMGSSPQLSIGPESTTALMTAVALGGLAAGDPGTYAVYAAGLAIVVGVLCIVAGVARLGFVAELLSRPVLVGYMCGIAALMVVSQLGHLTGMTVTDESAHGQVIQVVGQLGELHGPTFVLGMLVLIFLLVAHWKVPRLPGPLLGLLVATGAVVVLGLRSRGVEVVGPVESGFPDVRAPNLALRDLALLVPAAVGVALVGFTDTMLTGRAFASRRGDDIDGNRELLALGVANVAAGVAQGFPVSSSGSRTALGVAAGSRSQLHALVTVVAVVLAITLGSSVISAVPVAALGAVVVYAATRLVDVADIGRMARFRLSELLLTVVTAGGVMALGPLTGILVAVGLSVLDLLHRVARPHDGILGFVPGLAGMHDMDDYPTAEPVAGLVVYRYDSPLFFANAQDFLRRALVAVDRSRTPVEWFLLNAEANVTIDITGLDALVSLDDELRRRGIVLALARVKHELRADLERGGFLERIGEAHVFMTLPTAVAAYVGWYQRRHGRAPEGAVGS